MKIFIFFKFFGLLLTFFSLPIFAMERSYEDEGKERELIQRQSVLNLIDNPKELENFEFDSIKQSMTKCSICWEEIDYTRFNEIVILKCHSTHIYHKDCLKKWVKYLKSLNLRPTCCICNTVITDNLLSFKEHLIVYLLKIYNNRTVKYSIQNLPIALFIAIVLHVATYFFVTDYFFNFEEI